MKILYYFMQFSSPMFLWQNDNIVDELRHHSIYVDIFNPLNFQSLEQANEELVRHISENEYDLFMTCHSDEVLFIDAIKRIKKLNIPTLLICFDNLLIPYQHKRICRYFDLVWLTSEENQNLFKKWGATTVFLPYAANPYYYRPSANNEIERVCFIGTPYGSRVNTINELVNSGINVSLFGKPTNGNQPKHEMTKGYIKTISDDLRFPIGRKLLLSAVKQRIGKHAILNDKSPYIRHEGFAEDMSLIYSQYALALSTTTARNTGVLKQPVPVVNLRSFEIPMSGGIQFCEYNSELATYFEDEKEIIFYYNEHDMIEKAKYYLRPDNCTIRDNIRANARKRAETEHTWYARFIRIFDILNLSVDVE